MRILLIFIITMLFFGCTSKQEIEKNEVKGPEPSAMSHEPARTEITKPNMSTTQDSKPITQNSEPKTPNPELTTQNQSVGPLPTAQGSLPVIYFFYSPFCNASQAIWPEIEKLEAKYNNSVTFKKYSVVNSADLGEYNKFAIEYNLSNRVVPIVYFNNKTLIGRFEINDSLEDMIKEID